VLTIKEHIQYIPVCDSFGFHLFAVSTITTTVLISYINHN